MTDLVDELIQRAQARNGLPPPAKRRAIRKRAGVSLRDMAAAVGVSHAAIVHWEKDNNPRRIEHLQRYKRALDGLQKIP